MTEPTVDDLLREIKGLQNDLEAWRHLYLQAAADREQWKRECLQRRQLMMKAQDVQLYRVPITGVIGS